MHAYRVALALSATTFIQCATVLGEESRHWVDGHYEWRTEVVIVEPERYSAQEIPAVYETREDSNGRKYEVQVIPAKSVTITIPARHETRSVKVWIPGHYEAGPKVSQ